MKKQLPEGIYIREMNGHDPIPYALLLDADPAKEIVDKYFPVSDAYIALWAGEIVGIYVMCLIDNDCIEIKNIAVAEKYQHMGIGTMMLNDAEVRAKTKGYKTLVIGTGNTSFLPLYIYQKHGFDITGIKKNFIIDNYPEPLYENGIQVKHLIMLAKQL